MPCARVDIVAPGVQAEELEELTQSLRADLLLLDVDSVTAISDPDRVPAGARGVDSGMLGTLVLTMEQSLPLATAVISAIRGWLIHSVAPTRTVRVVVGDKSIELSGAASEHQDRLVDAFIEALTAG